jgi:hypothetical protein
MQGTKLYETKRTRGGSKWMKPEIIAADAGLDQVANSRRAGQPSSGHGVATVS